MTASGDLDPKAAFFADDDTTKLVYCPSSKAKRIRRRLGRAAIVVGLGEEVTMAGLVADLGDRGVRRLMVEGGGTILTQFLSSDLVDELHLAVAPIFVGDRRAPRFVGDAAFPWMNGRRATPVDVRMVGDVVLVRYALSDRFVQDAVEQSDATRCAVDGAGKVVNDRSIRTVGRNLATAFSVVVLFVASLAPGLIDSGSALALVRVPLEAMIALLVLAILPWRAARRIVAVLFGVLFVSATVGAALDRAFTATVGQPFNVVTGWPELVDGYGVVRDSTGSFAAGAILVLLGLVTLASILADRVVPAPPGPHRSPAPPRSGHRGQLRSQRAGSSSPSSPSSWCPASLSPRRMRSARSRAGSHR